MMSKPDSETVFAQVTPDEFSTDKLAIEGQPELGGIVEIEYSSDVGGAWASTSAITIRGELMYADIGTEVVGDNRGEWDGSFTIIVRDSERNRAVSVTLKRDSVARPTARTLAASKTRRGKRLGQVGRVTFTDEHKNAHAPVISALREVQAGDTLMVNGTEYGIERVYGNGPDSRPSGYTAQLTRPEGGRWTLHAKVAYDSARFSGPDCEYGEFLNLDVSSVRVGRYTERWNDDVRGREDTENTDDAFPAPHDAREGERVTVTLATEEADETVTGTVTNVRYFTREEQRPLGSPEERDPETTVELDDGRELILNNDTRHTSLAFREDDRHDTMAYRAMVKTPAEDGDSEYSHPYAVDITVEDADAEDAGEDGDGDGDSADESEGEDGGEPVPDGGVNTERSLADVNNPTCPCGESATYICECGCPCCGEDPCAFNCGGSVRPLGDVDDPESHPYREPAADGGEDVDALAEDVAAAFQRSDVAMNRVSITVSHGDVAVKANGHVSREDWTTLRDAITDVLDAEGFQYDAEEQWAFVEVTGRPSDARTDGGDGARNTASGPERTDRHSGVKRKLINSPIVCGAGSEGENDRYLGVYRDADATEDELETYHYVMELGGYIELDPDVLGEPRDIVSGEDVTVDAWVKKSEYDAENGGDTDD